MKEIKMKRLLNINIDIALLILRVGIGIMFILHGYPKMMGGMEKWILLGSYGMSSLGIDYFPAFWGFMSAFSEFFGGGFQRTPRGRDVSIDIQIDFKESVFGVVKEIIIPMPVRKNGKITREQQPISIKIPAGVNNGEMLRLSGRGETIPDGSPGDLYVKIHVRPSSKFRKEGAHLVSDIDVKLTDALLGFEYQVETLDGPITVKIPKGVTHGELLRVKGKGVPYNDDKRGDLLLRVQVKIPAKLSRKAKKLVEQLREEGL